MTDHEAPCRHCRKLPEADGDHSCPCPYRDDECPDHPLSERTRLIREQQRTGGGEITAVMVSGDTESGRSLSPDPTPSDERVQSPPLYLGLTYEQWANWVDTGHVTPEAAG